MQHLWRREEIERKRRGHGERLPDWDGGGEEESEKERDKEREKEMAAVH